jgi:hypothetical protein
MVCLVRLVYLVKLDRPDNTYQDAQKDRPARPQPMKAPEA